MIIKEQILIVVQDEIINLLFYTLYREFVDIGSCNRLLNNFLLLRNRLFWRLLLLSCRRLEKSSLEFLIRVKEALLSS